MERGKETGFKDKSGRNIHLDDVLQHRQGKSSDAHGGPRSSRVIIFAGKFQLVPEFQIDTKYGGITITETLCKNLVVLRCDHLPI